MKELMKKLKSPNLKAKDKRLNNLWLKYAIEGFKKGLEDIQKDTFKKEEEKKEEEKKDQVIEYDTEQEKNHKIDIENFKKM